MAIDIGTESVTLTVKERTWRIEIFCEYGGDPVIRAHREKVWLRPDGSLAQSERGVFVSRLASQIATQAFDGITGADLATKLALAVDVLRQEDIAALPQS